MKPLAIAVLTVFIAMTAATSAQAQANLYPEPLGSLYLSAQEGTYDKVLDDLQAPTSFNFYLIADIDFADIGEPGQNLTNGIFAWEAQVTLSVDLLILRTTLAPATSLNVGSINANAYDFVVGTGTTASVGDPFTLVTFQSFIGAAAPTIVNLCTIAPVTNPSVPGEAVWVESQPLNGCTIGSSDAHCIFRFANLGHLSIVVGLDTDDESFGSIKARY